MARRAGAAPFSACARRAKCCGVAVGAGVRSDLCGAKHFPLGDSGVRDWSEGFLLCAAPVNFDPSGAKHSPPGDSGVPDWSGGVLLSAGLVTL